MLGRRGYDARKGDNPRRGKSFAKGHHRKGKEGKLLEEAEKEKNA